MMNVCLTDLLGFLRRFTSLEGPNRSPTVTAALTMTLSPHIPGVTVKIGDGTPVFVIIVVPPAAPL